RSISGSAQGGAFGCGSKGSGRNDPHPTTQPWGIGNRKWGIGHTPPPALGNRQSEMGNRGGRPPHLTPHRLFFTAASPLCHSPFPRFPIPVCRFPREGWWGVERFPSALQSTL